MNEQDSQEAINLESEEDFQKIPAINLRELIMDPNLIVGQGSVEALVQGRMGWTSLWSRASLTLGPSHSPFLFMSSLDVSYDVYMETQ